MKIRAWTFTKIQMKYIILLISRHEKGRREGRHQRFKFNIPNSVQPTPLQLFPEKTVSRVNRKRKGTRFLVQRTTHLVLQRSFLLRQTPTHLFCNSQTEMEFKIIFFSTWIKFTHRTSSQICN